MRTYSWALVGLFVASSSVGLGADISAVAAASDADGNSEFNISELTDFVSKVDPRVLAARKEDRTLDYVQKVVQNSVNDILSGLPEGGSSVPIDQAVRYIQRVLLNIAEEKSKGLQAPWPGFKVRRNLVDTVDPRQHREIRPLIASYTFDDARDDDKESYVLLGTVVPWSAVAWEDGGSTLSVESAFGFDIDGSKPAEESTVTAGANLIFEQSIASSNAAIASYSIAASASFGTDRKFDRELYEGTFALSAASPVIRAGYYSWFFAGSDPTEKRGGIRFYWLPELRVEIGDVSDAGGNARLQHIKDNDFYLRVTPHISASISPTFVSSKLTLTGDYYHRLDVTRPFDHGYFEGSVRYDLDKNIALTLSYREGRRPPIFDRVEAVLLGLAVQF